MIDEAGGVASTLTKTALATSALPATSNERYFTVAGLASVNAATVMITAARTTYETGTRHVVVDLSQTPYMSSAGLIALHSIALLMRGSEPPSPESGWNAYHAITRDQTGSESGQPHIKLLKLQPKIQRTLEMTGMDTFFQVYSDLAAAVASF